MWTYIYPDELYHHGTKGQKWYIRRYQNQDGSLTPEGKERYGKDYDKNGYVKLAKKNKTTRRELRKATDEQLIKATNRARLEANYINAIYDRKMAYAKAHPEKVNKGKELLKSFAKNIVVPAAVNYGKEYLINMSKSEKQKTLEDMAKATKEFKIQNQYYEEKKKMDDRNKKKNK